MQAIHERFSQEIDDSMNPQEKNNNVSDDAVEVGVPAEELDNIVNNLEENHFEEGMRNQLQNFSKSTPGIHLERASSVPSPSSETPEGIPKASSEGAISSSVQKKKASKTVSDPSKHISILNENEDGKMIRPRSSSDPDADISNVKSVEHNTEPNTQHNKKRRVSLTALTFKKNKDENKKNKDEKKQNKDEKKHKHKNKNKDKHSFDSSDGSEQPGKSDDECKSPHPRVQDLLSDEHSDSDIDDHPPPKSFLRRMSVKVKNIVLGNEKEEKKFKVDIIDLTNDQGKVCYERVTVDELQNAILPGMSPSSTISTARLKHSAKLTMCFFFLALQGEAAFLSSMFNKSPDLPISSCKPFLHVLQRERTPVQ
jgi:hypothetical protein